MISLKRISMTFCVLTLCAASLPAQPPPDLMLNDLGIGVATPLALRHAGDGSGRLFIVERAGRIQIYEPGTGLLGSPFLDIVTLVDTTFEGGLLGLAFHPDYATNGFFYVNYTRTGSGGNPLETVIARYSVSAGDPNDADEGSAVIILTIDQAAANHNGGDLHFSPVDGYLYIGMGDGGASSATSQNVTTLQGKMLRIDPCDTAMCATPYVVPADNPFVGTAPLDEIWSIGFRNPYRWSFDRDTGDLLVADVGAGSREEVSFETAGAGGLNYGWNCREGDIPGPGGCTGTFVEPVMVYPHTGGRCSITGGYRYRGCIPGLVGTYIFADFCTAQVYFGTETSPGTWSFTEWTNLGGSVFGFGEDEDGEVYLLQGGSVARFESASTCVPNSIFSDGFESGDVTGWNSTGN